MNVKKSIISYGIAFIIGIFICAGIGYCFLYRPALQSVRAELDASRRDAIEYRNRAESSEKRVGEIKGTIDRSISIIGGTITTISDAKRKIREVVDTLRIIREKIEVEESDYNR